METPLRGGSRHQSSDRVASHGIRRLTPSLNLFGGYSPIEVRVWLRDNSSAYLRTRWLEDGSERVSLEGLEATTRKGENRRHPRWPWFDSG